MVAPGNRIADEQPDSTRTDLPSSQGPRKPVQPLDLGFCMRQMWACYTCGTKRQWGTVRLAKAAAAAKEAGEVIVHEPILWCAGCKDNRPHVFSHDEGLFS